MTSGHYDADRLRGLPARLLRAVLPVALFLGLWTAAAAWTAGDRRLFPMPWPVAVALADMARSGELARDVVASGARAFLGYVVGGALGILVGYVTARRPIVGRAAEGVIQLLRPLPPISLVPLFILWLGISEASKVTVVAFGCFFPVWIATHVGVQHVPTRYLWAARTLGASRLTMAVEVILPASLPTVISGLRASIATSFFCLVAAELGGAVDGLVFRINLAHLSFRVDRMLAGLVVLGLMSAGADALFTTAVHVAFPWVRANTAGGGR